MLAVDGDGRLALTYHESDVETDTLARYVFRGSTNPLDAKPIWQGEKPAAFQPPVGLIGAPLEISPFRELPPALGSGGDDTNHELRIFGDYETMTATQPTATCGPAGVFFPGFSQVDDKNTKPQNLIPQTPGMSDVVTRQVTLSAP